MDQKALQKAMKASADKVRPSRMFALTMRLRLTKKGWSLFWNHAKFGFKFATASTLVVIIAGSGVGTYAYTSPDVNAASMLYPIKQGIEEIEVGLTFAPDEKARMHMKMAIRRVEEAEALQRHLQQAGVPEKEAMEKTFALMEKRLDKSLQTAAVEHDTEVARKVLEDFEEKCGKMRERVMKLDASERAQVTAEFAQKRLDRIHEVRESLNSADGGYMPRFHLRDLKPDFDGAFLPPPPPPFAERLHQQI